MVHICADSPGEPAHMVMLGTMVCGARTVPSKIWAQSLISVNRPCRIHTESCQRSLGSFRHCDEFEAHDDAAAANVDIRANPSGLNDGAGSDPDIVAQLHWVVREVSATGGKHKSGSDRQALHDYLPHPL